MAWHPRTPGVVLVVVSVALAAVVESHEHGDDHIPDGMAISNDPIDIILWVHIFIQLFAFGVLFPLGMVLGMIKSRWHVPVQSLGATTALAGFFIGHMHGGRRFRAHNIHARFSPALNLSLACQVALGAYLKLHLEKGVHDRIRRVVRPVHSVLGKAIPVLAWTQMVLGGVAAQGMCAGGGAVDQCISHLLVGSAFVAYGAIMTLFLLAGHAWLRRTGRSQEFFDSLVLGAWGCLSALAEYRWGSSPWTGEDWQRTALGLFLWVAGVAGTWLSRDRAGRPARNFVPGFALVITGWSLAAQPGSDDVAATLHSVFGHTLAAAGLSRIVEVAFVLGGRLGVSDDGREVNNWQYLPILLIMSAGFLFMGSTKEQLQTIGRSPMGGPSYALVLFSLAVVFFLYVNVLVAVYDRGAPAPTSGTTAASPTAPAGHEVARMQARDAEEFELEGLMTDDENEGDGGKHRTSASGRSTTIRDDESSAGSPARDRP